jgi:glucose-1-phosphate cytidylyltransferase
MLVRRLMCVGRSCKLCGLDVQSGPRFCMKAVVLAGGLGTRLSEETESKPKPMVEIGGRPILWHILKIYSQFGINDFVICTGYKGYVIKEYFANYYLHMSDVTFNLGENSVQFHRGKAEPWRVTLVDTGDATMTGGRLLRVREHVADEEFCLTYGDGVAALDIKALRNHHRQAGRIATVTAVRPPGRFGAMEIGGDRVIEFREKPPGDGGWINGGFFVMTPGVFDYLVDDSTVLEQAPLASLARDGQLTVYCHTDFWLAMDTLRDKRQLESLWGAGNPPWKLW